MRPFLALALVALAAPAAWADLKLEHVRLTYGKFGPARPGTEVLPGEDVHVAFEVSGVDVNDRGEVEYSLSATLLDEAGTDRGSVPTATTRTVLPFGGTTVSEWMNFTLPDNFPPGAYRIRGILRDIRTKQKVTVEQPLRVAPRRLGLNRLLLALDAKGTAPSGGHLTLGQPVYVLGQAVGFTRKEDDVLLYASLTVLDEKGETVTAEPIAIAFYEKVPQDTTTVDFRWMVRGARPGRYTARIELRDEAARTSATYDIPLAVHAPPTPRKAP